MSEQLIDKRKPGIQPGLKLTRTTQGYQVKSGPKTYEVIVENNKIICNCPDFQKQHTDDPNYSCKHIIAALADFEEQQNSALSTVPEKIDAVLSTTEKGNGASKVPIYPPLHAVASPTIAPKQPHILIKRSLSADARIDSISVEIDFGLTIDDEEAVKLQALKALTLQDSIIKEFIGANQPKETLPEPPNVALPTEDIAEEAVDAIMTKVGIAQSKWGTSFYINCELPEGKTAKLFGNQKHLSHQIAQAGFSFPAEKIVEGIVLNIPCKVTTVLNGKFINIDKVFPV
jgi:predicted nucleic acid-binding Zn finger protein